MARQLKPEEYELLSAMIATSNHPELAAELNDARVRDMDDGGMGSIRFVNYGAQRMGCVLCEADALDTDAIPLDISINLDEDGHLFELDIWKVNFSPLRSHPSPSELQPRGLKAEENKRQRRVPYQPRAKP